MKNYICVIVLTCVIATVYSQEGDARLGQVIQEQVPDVLFANVQHDITIPSGAQTIDTIEAVVFGPSGTQVITYSDVIRPSLAGQMRTLDDIIFEGLIFLDAQKFRIMADDDAVDKYLALVQKQNNLTLDQLKDVFASAGYSYEEGRQQFRVLQAVNSMIDFKIRSHVIIPKKQVEDYYNAHPEIEEAEVTIERMVMPFTTDTERQYKALEYMRKTGKKVKNIQYDPPIIVKASEISPDKEYLFTLPVGSYGPIEQSPYGFELFHIISRKDEHIVSLDERYKEIADILKRPMFEELLNRYKKELFDASSVLYLGSAA